MYKRGKSTMYKRVLVPTSLPGVWKGGGRGPPPTPEFKGTKFRELSKKACRVFIPVDSLAKGPSHRAIEFRADSETKFPLATLSWSSTTGGSAKQPHDTTRAFWRSIGKVDLPGKLLVPLVLVPWLVHPLEARAFNKKAHGKHSDSNIMQMEVRKDSAIYVI